MTTELRSNTQWTAVRRAIAAREATGHFRTGTLFGALTSAALHALLLVLLGWEATEPPSPPDRQRAPNLIHDLNFGRTSAVWIEVEGGAIHPAHPDPAPLTRLQPVPKPTISALPLPEEVSIAAAQDSADERERTLLFGRYVGQINARIERVWQRPRTAPAHDAAFACRVQITQDGGGHVQEIMLLQCNGDTRWQSSLIRAIESASPLPEPPDAQVFTPQLVLEMGSEGFVPGGPTEGFEPDTRTASLNRTAIPPAPQATDFLDRLHALRAGRPGNIDLRFQGSPSPSSAHSLAPNEASAPLEAVPPR